MPVVESGVLILHVFHPGKKGSCSGVLYSDAGDGYGSYRVDSFRLEEAGVLGYSLIWTSEGNFKWPYSEVKVHTHGFNRFEVK